MSFLLALAPILVILILMAGLRWSAARAGLVGYLAALVLAAGVFGAGGRLLAAAHGRAALLALDVLLIIWAAYLLYRVTDEAGAIRTVGEALPHLTGDRGMLALVNAWVFASFLQGVGGFGVPVAVIAPLLIGLGFAPLQAVVMASVGHAWGVTFGSLGSAFQALMASTGLPGSLLAPPAALFLGVAGMTGGWMVAFIAGGWGAVRRLAGAVLLLGLVMAAGQYVVAVSGSWNLAAFAGAICGLAVVFPLARRFPGERPQSGLPDWRALAVAAAGYGVLVVVILAVQFVPVIHTSLGGAVLSVNFPEVHTSLGYVTPAGHGRDLVLFRHPGAVLLYVSVISYVIYSRAGRYAPGAVKRVAASTFRSLGGASLGILAMIAMAVVMENAGMTDTLARGLAGGVGRLFPPVAPWIGALGAFMTGSNTNSNVVFGALQLQTASLLGFPPAIILAGQTAGAALASVISPAKILVGASTTGMTGQEGLVLRSLGVYIGLLVLLVSLMTWAASLIF